MVSGILFDKDGTLFDFSISWSAWAQDFLGELACGEPTRAAELGRAIGFDWGAAQFAPDSPAVAGTPDDVAACLTGHFPDRDPAGLIVQMNQAAARAPMAPAVPLAPLLDGLRARGLQLGVATNDAEAPARAHLAEAGILDRFAFVAGCDSGFGAKPAPGQMRAFAGHTALPPDQVIMVGDSRHDLLAGRAAGMGTVAVLTGLATADELAPLADAVLPDIGGLPDYLDRLG
ncbi:HAD family hydrolase [Actibacterium ureilyticum]|uniref:HAD family hydrolase n=1 Tax=Actibacterium ureilyticum TaxID=1590614 RepID=UPI00159614D0|nr:HAD family hydrolase [Actibacterium ureilyticum]